MAPKNNRHVVPRPEGGWRVEQADAQRSSGNFETQKAAIDRAREIISNAGGGELITHGTDGRIRAKDTIKPGNDPYPPRG